MIMLDVLSQFSTKDSNDCTSDEREPVGPKKQKVLFNKREKSQQEKKSSFVASGSWNFFFCFVIFYRALGLRHHSAKKSRAGVWFCVSCHERLDYQIYGHREVISVFAAVALHFLD